MTTPNLSRLKEVELREAWQTEAGDFTPWLAEEENIKLVSEAIGIELEVEAQEKNVGPFRADILCKDVQNGDWVLIENQLERTDHTHLGQLLTYAAGLDAVTIVWIACRFTEEHRAALDWLNEKTPDNLAFIGLEVKLWKIANSPPAPKFNVISRPNEWTRAVTQSYSNPELAELCREYWTGVLDALAPFRILQPQAKPFRMQNIQFPVGWENFRLKAYFSTAQNQIGIWVACYGPNWKGKFELLQKAQAEIEASFGESLTWRQESNQGSITHVFTGYDPTDLKDWTRQHNLLAENVVKLYQAVNSCVIEIESHSKLV